MNGLLSGVIVIITIGRIPWLVMPQENLKLVKYILKRFLVSDVSTLRMKQNYKDRI
jgi:hypothetical protein